jgi:putative flippase GtrA
MALDATLPEEPALLQDPFTATRRALSDARRARTRLDRQVLVFSSVGAVSFVVHLGLFAALTQALGERQVANLVATMVASVVNTTLNRRWTFGIRGPERAVRHQLEAFALFWLTWGMSAGALWLLTTSSPQSSTALQTLVVAVSIPLCTVVRFVAMRLWIFRAGR